MKKNDFTLPENCDCCGVKLSDKEIVEIDDYKLYHPLCYIKFKKLDILKTMFRKQREFQRFLKTENNQNHINTMVLAMQAELTELLDSTPWKPWKKHQKFDTENYKIEIADLFHFLINLCLVIDLDAEEIYKI